MRAIFAVAVFALAACGTSEPMQEPVSTSGVHKATTSVKTGSDGMTVEQRNVVDRLKADNEPGSIKHLYVISAYSGQVLIYSTVRGKVTSSGKRLTPEHVHTQDPYQAGRYGIPIEIGGRYQLTPEVLGDDGTYGASVPYIFWFDVRGIYHQHYVEGGQIVHVSSQPLNVPHVVLNMETASPK